MRWSRDVLLTSALTHVMRTNASDTTYKVRAMNELWALCTNFTPASGWASPGWGTSWRMNLDISETMSGVALAYDWLYAELDPANRTLIANTLAYVLATVYRCVAIFSHSPMSKEQTTVVNYT